MHVTIRRTRPYERKCKKLLSNKEMVALEDAIAENPLRWPVIRGTGGVRKARHGLQGRGKSGGIRAAYYFHARGPTVYMLTVYAKSEKDDLSSADKAMLMQIVQAIKAASDEG